MCFFIEFFFIDQKYFKKISKDMPTQKNSKVIRMVIWISGQDYRLISAYIGLSISLNIYTPPSSSQKKIIFAYYWVWGVGAVCVRVCAWQSGGLRPG